MQLKIRNILSDGYERYLEVDTIDNKNFIVHYIEYSEYLTNDEETKLRNVGDILTTEMKIDLVSKSHLTDNELYYVQEFEKSSNIKAVIEVKELIDEYTIWALTSLCDEAIKVEFENKMTYQQNDRVYIEGSLEIAPVS
jgi:hypothetical protein